MRLKQLFFLLFLFSFINSYTQTTVIWELADEPNGISQRGFNNVINKARNHFNSNANDTIIVKIAEGTYDIAGRINFGNGATGDENGRLIFQGAGMDKTKLVFPVDGYDQMFAREIYRTEFRDMHFTRDQNTICQGTVVDISPGYFIVDIHKGFLDPTVIYDIAPGGMYLERYTPSQTNPRIAGPVRVRLKWGPPGARPELIDEEKNRWKVYLAGANTNISNEPFNYKPGEYINMKGKWDANAFRFLKGDDVVFENVKWTQTTRALVVIDNFKALNCRMERDEPINGQKPVLASNSGGFQILGDNALIQDLYCEGVGDDNIGIHTAKNAKVINSVFKTSPGRVFVDGDKGSGHCFENVINDNIDVVIYYNTDLNREYYIMDDAFWDEMNANQPDLLANGCDSPVTNAKFNYTESNYCASEEDPIPTILGTNGGTFTSYPEGLSIDSSTGIIDLSESTPRDYVIKYTTPNTTDTPSYHWYQAIVVDPIDDASFSYSDSVYCIKDTTSPVPTITGKEGGTFTSTPAGLSINESTGEVNISESIPGTYTITYQTPFTGNPVIVTRVNTKSCPNTSSTTFTINEVDDVSFSYSAESFCVGDSNPIPTITGVTGGTFTSTPAGLSIDESTGEVNISESISGTYTITYQTSGICGNSTTSSVTINEVDDSSFSYSAENFCAGDSNPIPTITGVIGGTFTSTPAGLSIDESTGEVNISESISGTYIVNYETAGLCASNSNVNVEITKIDTSTELNGVTITANAVGATYQWVDCNNDMAIIPGETNNQYTATENGSYAVQLTQNGCVETSSCVEVIVLSITSNTFKDSFVVYPNPTDGNISIDFKNNQKELTIRLYSLAGQLIESNVFKNTSLVEMNIKNGNGHYILEIEDNLGNKANIRLIKK